MLHLICDDDGHWYVIDEYDDDEFYAWVESTQDWRSEYTGRSFEEFMISGSPSNILFESYKER